MQITLASCTPEFTDSFIPSQHLHLQRTKARSNLNFDDSTNKLTPSFETNIKLKNTAWALISNTEVPYSHPFKLTTVAASKEALHVTPNSP